MADEKKNTGYVSPWQDQIKEIANKIINKEKFSYDLNGDALYKQYKDRYMSQGKQAMMDTMGQAAALTGGYGNSYAQSVGQQTYQGYLQGLNDQIPTLYQIALDKYTAEGNQMRDNLGVMMQQDDIGYGRYRDQLADQQAAYNKLMALMTEYHYEPTQEELDAAGMTMAQKNAIMKPYYNARAAAAEESGRVRDRAYEPPKGPQEEVVEVQPVELTPVAMRDVDLWKKMKNY